MSEDALVERLGGYLKFRNVVPRLDAQGTVVFMPRTDGEGGGGPGGLEGVLSRAMEKMALQNEVTMKTMSEAHQKQVEALTATVEALASQTVAKAVPKIPPLSSANVRLFSQRPHLPKWIVASLDHLLARMLRMEGEVAVEVPSGGGGTSPRGWPG